jgi:Rad3-related DNA helicases
MTGFEDLPAKAVENVFPEENLLIGYKRGIGTRFSDLNSEMFQKIGEEIQSIIQSIKRKTIVFFPSRNLMNQVIEIIGNKGILVDSGDMDQIDLMHLISKFKKGNRPLFTVIGGRLSEGINLPGKLLEIVILAGIPYPKPDVKQRTIMAYYDHLYGRGWDYAVTFPTLVKMRQTIGRLIRNVDDRGVALILDERAEIFKDYLRGLREFIDVRNEIANFFVE